VFVKPFKLSLAAISISRVPHALISLKTEIQKADYSFLPNHNPNSSSFPLTHKPSKI
jgi:hypothetical protein